MPWEDNQYRYTRKKLRKIFANYEAARAHATKKEYLQYLGNNFKGGAIWETQIEEQVDFDNALDSFGKGKWHQARTAALQRSFLDIDIGIIRDRFKYFTNLQKVVIAELVGIDDITLEFEYGIENPERLRGEAFRGMCRFLNGD